MLDAGLSGTSLGWSIVQSELSKFTTVCSYDRAGYAWSEPSSTKRTSLNIANELHTLLHAAQIPGPYVLVGHSFGGCNMLIFADLYPDQCAGVVLVDSVHEEMKVEPPKSSFSQWFLSILGYKRLRGPSPEIEEMFRPLPEAVRKCYIAQMNKRNYAKTVFREMDSLNESLSQLSERKIHLKDKPLIVVTAGLFASAEKQANWTALQKRLLLKSTNSKQVVAKRSDHMINHHQPAIIVEAVMEIVNNSRSHK